MLRLVLIEVLLISLVRSNCLNKIINSNFNERATIVIDSTPDQIFELPKFEFDFENVDILETKRDTMQVIVREKTNNYILGYQNLNQLNETLEKLRNIATTWNSRAKFLINCYTFINQTSVSAIMRLLWEYNIYNFLVTVQNETTELYGYDFLRSNCGKNITADLIGTCQNLTFKNFFPNHEMNDMCNNSFVILWTTTEPFAINATFEKNPGMLISLIKVIAEKSNLGIEFNENIERYQNGFSDNLNFQEDLANNVGDIFVALNGYEYEKCVILCDCTGSVNMESMNWILPKAQRKPFWKSIFAPFTMETWTYLGVTFLFAVLTFWATSFDLATSKILRLSEPLLVVIQLLLGNSVTFMSRNKSFKLFFVFLSLAFIIINTDYKGKLFVFLSNPGHEEELETLDDILNSSLPIIFFPALSVIFMFTGSKNEMIFDRFIPSNVSNLETLDYWVLTKDYVTIINWGQIIFKPHFRKMFNTLEVFSFHNPYVMRRDHILFDRIEIMIMRILEAGLYNKWVSDIQTEYFRQTLDEEADGVFKLTIHHLEGAFILLAIGYTLALIAFIFEHLNMRIKCI